MLLIAIIIYSYSVAMCPERQMAFPRFLSSNGCTVFMWPISIYQNTAWGSGVALGAVLTIFYHPTPMVEFYNGHPI